MTSTPGSAAPEPTLPGLGQAAGAWMVSRLWRAFWGDPEPAEDAPDGADPW